MDLSRIKNLVKQNGDKFILVENGEPEVVMMSWHEYQKLIPRDSNIRMYPDDTNNSYRQSAVYSDNSDVEFPPIGTRLAQEMSGGSLEPPEAFKETEFMAPVLAESVGLPVRLEDIRLEDLPI